ncbi:MAG: SDR family NAD(P)-dependent oxidoreductase [Lysobacteraceae bacterium]|nr:MAG: SDR family NAD(P)-dependent oxidoreductase [Xanthomonadaceae bacterium]
MGRLLSGEGRLTIQRFYPHPPQPAVHAACGCIAGERHAGVRAHPVRDRGPSGGAFHEGHAAVPDVRVFQPYRAGAQAGRCRRLPHRQRARGAGDPRQPAALFELADLPAVVHQRRTDRRLRHHPGAVRVRRAGADAGGGRQGVSAAPTDTGTAPVLAGRVVLVAGAHGGLGSAASQACARAGAIVVLLGRKVPKLNRLHDAIVKDGGQALLYPMDLEGAAPDDYAELAERIGQELGRLDGVLHCAAEFKGLTPLLHTDPADFARALHVNLTARWWLTQACLPLLQQAPDAAVVFAIDDLDLTGRAFWGGYGIAQQALATLVGMLDAELGAASPVRVAGLQPGPMRTTLRGRAYMADQDRDARDPANWAGACVELLSAAGAAHRGRVWKPAA